MSDDDLQTTPSVNILIMKVQLTDKKNYSIIVQHKFKILQYDKQMTIGISIFSRELLKNFQCFVLNSW